MVTGDTTTTTTTTTTTMDPLDEFCHEACKAGVGGPECGCPDHPIGRARPRCWEARETRLILWRAVSGRAAYARSYAVIYNRGNLSAVLGLEWCYAGFKFCLLILLLYFG
ncbi:hypothetical protein O3P69_002530 [Scylla paramamosain]|uniref:Uncharacterized protein n=1 Tax=Scylla paramamosain TaxID=85552 RepID=A0AAW0UKZ5_SCYPA